jgi:hypothetical protein
MLRNRRDDHRDDLPICVVDRVPAYLDVHEGLEVLANQLKHLVVVHVLWTDTTHLRCHGLAGAFERVLVDAEQQDAVACVGERGNIRRHVGHAGGRVELVALALEVQPRTFRRAEDGFEVAPSQRLEQLCQRVDCHGLSTPCHQVLAGQPLTSGQRLHLVKARAARLPAITSAVSASSRVLMKSRVVRPSW